MKPILFAEDETNFTTNGLGRLDCISCEVIEERNGMYELEAVIPITSNHASEIHRLSIIGVIPSEGSNIQAFVVYNITKPMNGKFKVYARHISYRLSDIPCTPFSIESSAQACGQALAGLKTHAVEDCPFNFNTDVITVNSYTQKAPSSIRQRLGGVEGSILDQFGGEYKWDNFNVSLLKQRGRLANTTGITLRYGKNITDINQEEEISKTATGVLPYWIDTDGNNLVMLSFPDTVIYSPHADDYPYHLTQVLDLSAEFQEKPSEAQMKTVAQTYVNKSDFGVPKVSIKVSFVDLWKSEEYKEIAALEQVKLCDEITVDFQKLGIEAVAKVVKTNYDVLKERYNSIEVGSIRTTLAQAVTDRDKDIDTTFIEQLTRVNTAISNATAWLTSAQGYVVAVKNQDGTWKELLFMNTNDPTTATAGIRINNNGIGFFSKAITPGGNVLDGPYSTAWTMDGRLGDFANKNYWNFVTGEFSLSASTTVGGYTVQEIANTASASAQAAAEAASKIYTDTIAQGLQDQIDDNITTWYYEGEPEISDSSYPYNTWLNPDTRKEHNGDLYYDKETGYAYRFLVVESGGTTTYSWTKISDSDIEAALQAADDAWDLADNKRRVFVAQPEPPYDIGDLWVQGTSGDIMRCQTKKISGQVYNASDWIKASKYTDDTYVVSWINNTYSVDKNNLEIQIDKKAETWYQAADPSTGWSNDEKPNHVGDLWYKTANNENTTWIYQLVSGTYQWVQENVPKAVFDEIDGKAQIFISQPVPPYNIGDTWMMGTTGDIKTCTTARSSGNYVASDWSKLNKYTDDSALTTFINNTYADDKSDLMSQIDKRAETFYQATDPSLDWADDTATSVSIKFNADCNTETNYDYIDVYYKDTASTYARIRETGSFGNVVINIPAKEFWIYWHTDDSSHNYYGWKVDSVEYYSGTSYTTPTASGISSLPAYTPVNKAIAELESAHPYSDSINVIFHSKAQLTHKGDLWYRTTDATTWYFDGAGWIQQDVPNAVFDEIDGKAQIFTSQPIPPYNIGDLWCVGYSGDILTCIVPKTASQSYSSTDWEKRNKYTDDTMVKAQYGTCSTTGSTAAKVVSLSNFELYTGARITVSFTYKNTADNATLNVNSTGAKYIYAKGALLAGKYYWNDNALVNFVYDGTYWVMEVEDQTETFKRLTNDGQAQGIYMSGTDLLINASYIQSGSINANLITTGELSADLIKSGLLESYNYSGPSSGQVYASNGLQINMSSGKLITKSFLFDGSNTEFYAKQIIVKANSSSDTVTSVYLKVILKSNENVFSKLTAASLTFEDPRVPNEPVGVYDASQVYLRSSDWTRQMSVSLGGGISFYDTTTDKRLNITMTTIEKKDDSGNYVAVRWYSSSDRRMKKNIKDISLEISRQIIDRSEPKTFEFINSDKRHYGMIAQDVRKVLDELGETDVQLERSSDVSDENAGIKDQRMLEYEEYIPLLINYVKDLREIVNRQQAEIDELKAIVKSLLV